MISKIITDEQINKIHKSSVEILERIGVIVPHEEMINKFIEAGAIVDRKTQCVKISEKLIMKSLEQCGKQWTIYGRDLSQKASFGVGKRNYNSSAGEASWLDDIGKNRRYATLNDVQTATRFCDALDNINIVGAMADPHEFPIEWRSIEVAATMIKNTNKPITFWFHNRVATKYIIEMLIALRGDVQKATEYPLCYPFFEPISPLRFPFNGIDLLFETARINLPVPIGPMAQMGLSAPGTIAGTLVQENAEILAGICITQLIRQGMPVCYGGVCHAFDMSATQIIFAGPEQAILGVAMTQMGKYYGFPVYINVGLTDSKRLDAQAGLEIASTLVLVAAAGADIFGHMGICGADQTSSLDILVLQNEIISYIESVNREIDFSDEAIGINEIAEVRCGGSFIDRMHTALHFRKELWFPKLLDRNYYQVWLDNGAKSMEERCRQRKEEILVTHSVEPIAKDLEKKLDDIVAHARQELYE
ncbi:MAG: trimethylamine methyltransferase family protein [Candidatus Firestonebacteria bacterium]